MALLCDRFGHGTTAKRKGLMGKSNQLVIGRISSLNKVKQWLDIQWPNEQSCEPEHDWHRSRVVCALLTHADARDRNRFWLVPH